MRELRRSTKKRSCAETPEAEQLRKAARDQSAKTLADREHRRELERKAAREDLEAQTALADAKRLATEARRQALEAASALRRQHMERQTALARASREARWLQTEFPLALANRLLLWRRGLGRGPDKVLERTVRALLATQRCERNAVVPRLWEDDKALTSERFHLTMPGGKRSSVRCTPDFEWLLFGHMWARESRTPDAGHAFLKLMDRVLPQGSSLFRRRYTPQVLFAACDGIVPKVFVHAIMLVSKWLGEDKFPQGGFAWPPPVPAEATAG